MSLEEELKLERAPVTHKLLSTEDYDEVSDQSLHDRRNGRHWALSRNIMGQIIRKRGKRDVGKNKIGNGSHGGRKERRDGETSV